jgi:hypothetical protein
LIDEAVIVMVPAARRSDTPRATPCCIAHVASASRAAERAWRARARSASRAITRAEFQVGRGYWASRPRAWC